MCVLRTTQILFHTLSLTSISSGDAYHLLQWPSLLPCMPFPPATHVSLPYMPHAMHAPHLPCMSRCHMCPLSCTPLLCMPQTCMLPCHAHPPPTMYPLHLDRMTDTCENTTVADGNKKTKENKAIILHLP